MALSELSDVLWTERRLLELLLFKLEEEQLVLTSGRTRWLAHATREVETVLDQIRDAELAKIPYVVVWGERESLAALAVRRRGGDQATIGWEALLSELQAAAKL